MKKLILSLVLVTLFLGTVFSQIKGSKIPLIGSVAPSFTAETTVGTITFPDDFGMKWKILFSHPQDFTPVCSSELLELAYMQKDFKKLGAQLAIISTDDVAKHKLWKAELEKLEYKGRATQKIDFPLIDDHTYVASKAYGMLHEPTSTNKDIRGVFIIDPENVVRSINFYPMQVGRNMKEIERILVALQTADKEKVYTPANWVKGDDVIIPYNPFKSSELSENTKQKSEYYNVGSFMYFKKESK